MKTVDCFVRMLESSIDGHGVYPMPAIVYFADGEQEIFSLSGEQSVFVETIIRAVGDRQCTVDEVIFGVDVFTSGSAYHSGRMPGAELDSAVVIYHGKGEHVRVGILEYQWNAVTKEAVMRPLRWEGAYISTLLSNDWRVKRLKRWLQESGSQGLEKTIYYKFQCPYCYNILVGHSQKPAREAEVCSQCCRAVRMVAVPVTAEERERLDQLCTEAVADRDAAQIARANRVIPRTVEERASWLEEDQEKRAADIATWGEAHARVEEATKRVQRYCKALDAINYDPDLAEELCDGGQH